MFENIVSFIKNIYPGERPIPLHVPRFTGNEKKYLMECIDSTYVSSVGNFVNKFEEMIKEYTGAGFAVACVNGTAALHTSLLLAGVKQGDEVITQPLTFVATANAIKYCNASPVFLDVDKNTLGLSADKLEEFLLKNTEIKDDGFSYNNATKCRIAACVPMHTFGMPAEIDKIFAICKKHNITLIEDSTESLGSFYKNRHTGTFGLFGVLSFNGNKTITTGGGGMILTNDESLAKKAKHITTTAKLPHQWEFFHNEVGYNYRLPNINAALGCAQMENLPGFIENKRELSKIYSGYFSNIGIEFIEEQSGSRSNFWLNTILMKDREERDKFLKFTNDNGVMTRPAWTLLDRLPMFKNCQAWDLENSKVLENRIVNIPSSVRL